MRKEGRSFDYAQRKVRLPPHPLFIAITNELETFGLPYAEKFINEIFKSGKAIVFVDGLDEATHDLREVFSDGLQLIKKIYAECKIIVTCRSAEDELVPENFRVFEISPLNATQKKKFVNLWFSEHPKDAKSFMNQVSNTHVWDISNRPLLLTMLCALFENGGDIPKHKVDLYKECAELALRKWDSIRRIKRNTVFGGISSNQRMDILSKIASEMTLSSSFQISSDSMANLIGIAMEESGIEGDPNQMLTEFMSNTGLIQQVSLDKYSFSHKSMQEYFAARYFAATAPSLPSVKLRDDKQWLVTTEMTACMLPDATPIISDLLNGIINASNNNHSDLDATIRLICNNPLTISIKGRRKLIAKALHKLRMKMRKFDGIIVLDNKLIKSFETEKITNRYNSNLILESHGLCLIFLWNLNGAYIFKSLAEEYVRLITLCFKLLVPTYSLIINLLKDEKEYWIKNLLECALIHTDHKMLRGNFNHLLSIQGSNIYESMEFNINEIKNQDY